MKLSEKIALSGLVTVLTKVFFAGASIKILTFNYTFGTIDAATCAAVLTPTLGAVHLESWVATKVVGGGDGK